MRQTGEGDRQDVVVQQKKEGREYQSEIQDKNSICQSTEKNDIFLICTMFVFVYVWGGGRGRRGNIISFSVKKLHIHYHRIGSITTH